MHKLAVIFALSLGLLSACDRQKAPAQAAFAQVQAAFAPVSAELEKYAPEQYEQLTAQLDAMKAKLNSKDYAGALTAQPQVMMQLVIASGAAGKRKNQLAHQLNGEWQQLKSAVPTLLAQLGVRISNLQHVTKLPGNITLTAMQQARESLAELNIEWSSALAAISERDAETAVTKGRDIEKHASELAIMLGLKPAT